MLNRVNQVWPSVQRELLEVVLSERIQQKKQCEYLKSWLQTVSTHLLEGGVQAFVEKESQQQKPGHQPSRLPGLQSLIQSIAEYQPSRVVWTEDEFRELVELFKSRVEERAEDYDDYCKTRQFWNQG